MKKILLTGHLGFIGSKMYKKLIKKYNVIGYDLKDGNDIRNKMQLDELFEKENFDTVLHLAALAGARRGDEYPDDYISTNINGTRNIVAMCDKYKVNKLIAYSSSSVLGGCKIDIARPFKTTDSEGVITQSITNATVKHIVSLNEDVKYNPKSIYGMTKVMTELLVLNSRVENKVIIRPFTVYGEEGRKDMVIYKWIEQIKNNKHVTVYGDGDTTRGYTYVEDLIDATIKLIDTDVNNEILHIGGSECIKLIDILNIFDAHCAKRNIEFNYDKHSLSKADPTHSIADTSLAEYLIDFKPRKNFIKNLKKILKKEL